MTTISCLTFWLTSEERGSFAITMLLVMVATMITNAGTRPPVRQSTMLETFTAWCVVFAIGPIFYTVMHVGLNKYIEKQKDADNNAEDSNGQGSVAQQTSRLILSLTTGATSGDGAFKEKLPEVALSIDLLMRIIWPGLLLVMIFEHRRSLIEAQGIDVLSLDDATKAIKILLGLCYILATIMAVMVTMSVVKMCIVVMGWCGLNVDTARRLTRQVSARTITGDSAETRVSPKSPLSPKDPQVTEV